MAKQFKFNIKNAQLKEALNLGEVKKKVAAKTEEEQKTKEQKTPKIEEEEKKPSPRMRARSKSAFAESKKDKKSVVLPKEDETQVDPFHEEEEVVVDVVEEARGVPTINLPNKASPEGLKKLKALQKEKLGPTGKHIKDFLPPKPPPSEKTAKAESVVKKSEANEEKDSEEHQKGKRPKPKEFKDLKPKKGKSKGFDSRDKQGLRPVDEGGWRKRKGHKISKPKKEEIPVVRPTELKVRLPMTIKDLAQEMKLKASELIAKLFIQGIIVTLNDSLDDETTVQLLGQEFGCEITIDNSLQERIRITGKTIKEEIAEAQSDAKLLRPPIVTFMGHVDHGKTSLIDAIRQTNVVAQESGAITQHIGAFKCKTDFGAITVLDTPGHEAFSAMRARGAEVTDIVVLVVAGDEGFRQQTEEALQHAKAAGVTIIVAINKSDKPNFNPETVYRHLADRELLPEAWGGQTITVNTSAVTKDGLKELLEMLALQAEVLELVATPKTRARGVVLEAEMHKGMGIQATILVMNGTLAKGDSVVFETNYGKVRTMKDESGKDVKEAGPATPVVVTGLNGLPKAGDEFIVVATEKDAKEIAERRELEFKEQSQMRATRTLESLLQKSQENQKKTLNAIIRADVQGSMEALKTALSKIESDKVDLNIIFNGVGEISESDVQLAAASNAVIIGFHNSVEKHAEQLVKEHGVQVRLHNIIYHAIDDVKELMTGQLDQLAQEEEKGKAQVLQTFKSSQLGIIAGCMVQEGTISRNHKARILRNNEVIFKGDISSLKRVKEDVKEVKSGFECGVVFSNTNDIQPDDIIETYEIVYVTQTL